MNALTAADVIQGEFGILGAVEVWLIGEDTPTINGVVAGCTPPGILLDGASARRWTGELGHVFIPWSAILLIREVQP